MPAIISILIIVVGMFLIVLFFNILPQRSMNNFVDKVNSIRIGMTRNEVHNLLNRKPYKADVQIDYSTGKTLYDYELYKKWSQSSDLNTYKQTITTMEIEIKVYYENNIVIGVEQI